MTDTLRSQLEGLPEAVFELIPAGVVLQSVDGAIRYANRAAAEILRMPKADIAGRRSVDPVWNMVLEDGTPVSGEDHPAMITLRTGEPLRNQVRGLYADDPARIRWLIISTEPRFDAEGLVAEVLATFQDITEQVLAQRALIEHERALRQSEQRFRVLFEQSPIGIAMVGDTTARHQAEQEARSLQAQLQQTQRLEAVGRLAGGVAHEFNNLLTTVMASAGMLREDLAPVGEHADLLQDIIQASARAAELTNQLLAYSRKQHLSVRVLDLAELVRNATRTLDRLIGEHISLRLEGCDQVVHVRADASQLVQCLLNLVINARDAMPDGGALSIRLTQHHRVRAEPAEGSDPWAFIEVRDTGKGISEDHLPTVFEPFFTTKAPGGGTGLGLSMVHGIIAQHGGRVTVDSQLGVGSTFTISLPVVVDEAAAGVSGPASPPSPRGKETILVVEDDDLLRGALERALARLGYRLLVARDGEHALALSRAHPQRIQLLLSDVVMPGINGFELAAQLERERPETKILLTSGYAEDHRSQLRASSTQQRHFLGKPYQTAVLAKTIREILEAET